MCYNSRMKEARAEHKPYPTDLTDAQWSEIEPLYSGMRNRKWSKRELTNAVLYIVKTGCQWRQLPHDFPPYQTVYSFFSRGAKSGLWEKILAHLVEKTRKDAGKSAEPHYALIDSQSVKTVADNEKRGIDGGKKAKGRKRHAVIDTMGNLLASWFMLQTFTIRNQAFLQRRRLAKSIRQFKPFAPMQVIAARVLTKLR